MAKNEVDKDVNAYREYEAGTGTMKEATTDSARAINNMMNGIELQQQMLDDTAERNNLSDEEVEDFLYENYADKESTEYLVDGAILTCTNSTIEDVFIRNKLTGSIISSIFPAPIDESIQRSEFPDIGDKALGRLTVTENLAADSNLLKHATVADCVKETNIPYFGNCKREPDRAMELYIFDDILKEENKGSGKVSEGSCKYLMKLESEWENYEIGQEFLSFPDDAKGDKSGITMTSMLFCKHGGFIYPVASGQTVVNDEIEEEIEEELEAENEVEQVLVEPEITDPQAVKEYVWAFFCNKGLSEVTVAGILGNVQQECDFDLLEAAERTSKRFGLFQWSSDSGDKRRAAFDSWAAGENLDINLISTQCEYAYVEMTTGGMFTTILDENANNPSELICNYETLINAKTPEEAAKIFATAFERCVKPPDAYYRDANGVLHYKDIQLSFDRQDSAVTIYDDMSKR